MKLPLFVGTGLSIANGLLNNLVSYYKCDTNGSFPDAHGSNNGTINGATFTASGKINGGYDYDGVNDYVDLPIATYDNSSSFSISGWVKYDNVGTITDVRWYEKSNSDYSGVLMTTGEGLDAGKPWFGVYNGTSFNYAKFPTASTNGTFYHIVGVFNRTANTTDIYVDGVAGTQATGIGTVVNGSFVHSIGRYFTQHFDGVLDEVGIWNKALTSTEVTALYNAGDGLSYNNFTT